MRNAQHFIALLALRIHPGPQVFGMIRIDRSKWHSWDVSRVPEDNVAMHIPVVRRGTPFIGNEGGKLSRLIVFVSDADDFLPDAPSYLRTNEFLNWLVFLEAKSQ